MRPPPDLAQATPYAIWKWVDEAHVYSSLGSLIDDTRVHLSTKHWKNNWNDMSNEYICVTLHSVGSIRHSNFQLNAIKFGNILHLMFWKVFYHIDLKFFILLRNISFDPYAKFILPQSVQVFLVTCTHTLVHSHSTLVDWKLRSNSIIFPCW